VNWGNHLFSRIRQLHAYTTTNKIDIVHCHKYSDLFYTVLTNKFYPFKLVFTEHMGGGDVQKKIFTIAGYTVIWIS
jgi:hypothetical protein